MTQHFKFSAMRLIIITPPTSLRDEPILVTRILERSPVTVHLRKPGRGGARIADYLRRIPTSLHPCIMVHGHADLLERFNLKGIHFTEKERLVRLRHIGRLRRQRPDVCISSAFHRMADISDHDGLFDYLFLSPIYDSISKAGYRAAFDPDELKDFLLRTDHCVVALGGINGKRLQQTVSLGFKGAAVLGAVWQAPDPVAAAGRLWAVCRRIKSTGM